MNANSRRALVYADDEARWQAVLGRDVAADGHFVYAVRTTGVYCRPSSGARLPRRGNVEFFDTAEAAQRAGYRASRRAMADRSEAAASRADMVTRACRQIEASDKMPRLAELAAAAGLSESHFHRVFRKETGLTPRGYAAAWRARRLREQLAQAGISVTDAMLDSGFNSASSFHAASGKILGMPAGKYRDGGSGEVIRFALGECSLGSILVAQSGRGVCAITLGDEPQALLRDFQQRFANATLVGADAGFEQVVAQVVAFVESPASALDLPLDIRGTAFQERVWQALREIPAGNTVDYSAVAQRIGRPRAVRAVAQACGANAIAVAIPCHRVVRRDGGLSGYRWGVERKRELLRREAQEIA